VETDDKEIIKLIDDPGDRRSCIASIRHEIRGAAREFYKFQNLFYWAPS
jgi:hypothetical protein